jgi:hypothetical protein
MTPGTGSRVTHLLIATRLRRGFLVKLDILALQIRDVTARQAFRTCGPAMIFPSTAAFA